MECRIDQYYFVYNEQDNVINVYNKTGINVLTVIKLDKKLNSKKEFDIECSDWYFKIGR